MLDKVDPFVEVRCSNGSKQVVKTKTIDNNESPIWNHADQFELEMPEAEYSHLKLTFTVFDYNYSINSIKGKYEADLAELFKSKQWFN